MYGYVQVYRPDLRFREYEVYRSHYCGLCHALQQRCNAISRLTLSYDFTFLSLLLDALYEPEATLLLWHWKKGNGLSQCGFGLCGGYAFIFRLSTL